MIDDRYRQLTEKGLSPFQICGLVGRSEGLFSLASAKRGAAAGRSKHARRGKRSLFVFGYHSAAICAAGKAHRNEGVPKLHQN